MTEKNKIQPAAFQPDKGQLSASAARVYEDLFVPALFQQWAGRVSDAAQVKTNDTVLDVACGTGILTRYVAERVKPYGNVIGLDINDAMLAVAAEKAPQIEWCQGAAEAIPYMDASFDAVVSQFGLMFFADRGKAIQEMMRVVRPKGYIAVAVWNAVDRLPGYAALINLLQRQFGAGVANMLRTPFSLGDTSDLLSLFQKAGAASPVVTTRRGKARFPSLRSWVYTEVKGWAFSDLISDRQLEELMAAAETELKTCVASDGTVIFDTSAHIVTVHM